MAEHGHVQAFLMYEIEKEPYAAFLEESIKTIFECRPSSMAVVAVCEDGNTLTGYYNADARDKAMFAYHIQSDMIMDIVTANVGMVKEAMENEEEEQEET